MEEAKQKSIDLVLSLKKLKKDGKLDSDECLQAQTYKWRNSIDYKYLERWLTSDNEELRLQTLELLVTSKKSTLYFSEHELNLVMTFLRCNIREKIEFVPLIKKVLKRLNDSYMVLKRQLEKEIKLKDLKKQHPEFQVPVGKIDTQASVDYYKKFVSFLHKICLKNIYPGAVNSRKKSSLQILCLMDEFLCEDLKNSLWTLNEFRDLFDCLLLDTYEVNKDMAFRLIKSSNLVESFFNNEEKTLELVNIAVQMGNSIRPLDSITAAYMLKISMLLPNIQKVLLELIEFEKTECIQEKITFYMIMLLKTCLEKPVKLATENIVIASSKHSLYGYVFCIHSILSSINLRAIVNDECWRDLLSRIVNMCFELNTAVSQIVNSSSPEGHLPMDLNPRHLDNILQDSNDLIITPQMVLLCSWRTVKEISLLFGHLTYNATIFNEKTKTGLLTESQIKEIGDQLVTLLCETKHRGAFEQTHVGFGQLCNRLWHLDDEQVFLKQLPKTWLQQLLLAIVGLTPKNSKLCATRRSAGVPFMVQALVTSEIIKKCDAKKLIFHSVMRILLKLVSIEENFSLNDAENILFKETVFEKFEKSQYLTESGQTDNCIELNEVTEIKTHSLNVLRALYRHCLLGELVKDYIADGFVAAFRCYDGQSWAERNAATLLFSSLVVRVFGVQRTKDHVNLTLHNRMTGKNFFEKFPSLLPFLLNELTIFVNANEDQIKPKIQSILLILSRLYSGITSEGVEEDWKVDQFIDLVSKCGKSKVYKTRELAARALVPLLTEKNVSPITLNLLNLIMTGKLPINLLHGYILQLLEIVRSPQFAKVTLPSLPFENFLEFLTNKALLCLEMTNDGFACYPVCTGALEIYLELLKSDLYSGIHKNELFSGLLERIQMHLSTNKILKCRPGIELYELAAMNVIVATIENKEYTGPLISDEYTCAQFWEKMINHKSADVLKIVWSTFISVVQKTNSPMLYDLAFMTSIKVLEQPVDDPDLQDAILEFIRKAIVEMEKDSACVQYTYSKKEEKNYMCLHIFNKLSQQLKENNFYPRREFFKLFGKAFGFLLKNKMDTEVPSSSKKIIYDALLSHSDMEANLECRLSISEILLELYIDIEQMNDIYFILNWWTTLLNLLYDDNAQVRSNATQIVCKILPETHLDCETIVINTFFAKFVSTVRESIEAVAAACFCWSMKSAAVVLEEMDETDVFNKSCNYECFEPLQIANHCLLYMKSITMKHNFSMIKLTKPIKEWLNNQLDMENNKFEYDTIVELIDKYRTAIPETEKDLRRILDPTYPAKLIKELAYEQMRDTVISVNAQRNVAA